MANKFDKQLERMEYLMSYRMPTNESKNSNSVAYSAEAADGNRYGIIKENSKYYIKVCKNAEKANLAESYDYIHGITAKKENEYKSYNEATKHFELKLMSLNEAHNGNVRTSTVDFKRGEKTLAHLTEEARKELDRMHTILENSMTIGMKNTGNPEAPKTASFSASIGHPFTEKGEAKLDKDLKSTATAPEKQGEPFDKEEKVSDADLESDKAPKGCESCKDYEDAKYVPADAVAAKKPTGGKVVRVNESEEDILGMGAEKEVMSDEDIERLLAGDDELSDFETNQLVAGEVEDMPFEKEGEFDYMPDEEDETDARAFDRFSQMESKKVSLNRIVESVCEKLVEELEGEEDEDVVEEEEIPSTDMPEEPMMESFTKMIDKLVKEEVTNLNVFGKHPGYRKKPMTTPANTEVVKTKGDKDWNDDSVKGEKPFGQKIGSSAPYTEMVKVLTDAVMKSLTEGLKKK